MAYTLSELIDLFCDYKDRSSNEYINALYDLLTDIEDYINTKEDISTFMYDKLFSCLFSNNNYKPYNILLSEGEEFNRRVILIINKLLSKNLSYKVNNSYISIILNNSRFAQCIPILIKSGNIDENDIINIILEEKNNIAEVFLKEKLVNLANKKLYNIHSVGTNKIIANAILEYDGDIPQDNIIIACGAIRYTKDIIKALVLKGHQVNNSCLDIVCKNGSVEDIDFITKFKLIPNKNNFKSALCSDKHNAMNKLMVLIENGYIPDQNDIEDCISNNIYIPNIEKFNIIITENIVSAGSSNYKYFSNCEFTEGAKKMYFAKLAGRHYYTSDIDHFIEKNNIVIDDEYINIIFKSASRNNMLYLLKYSSIEMTFEILDHYMKTGRYSHNVLKYLICKIRENQDKKIEVLQTELNELKSSMELKEVPKEEISKEKPLKVKKDIILLPLYTKKVPKNKNRKCFMPKKYMMFFGIDKKEKISYTDMRKQVTSYIISNNMICEDDKKLIDLAPNMRNLLGIEKKGFIKFEELDNIINLFYK